MQNRENPFRTNMVSLRIPMNDSTSTRRSLAKGDFVTWYRIERVLGQGGFGITYLATDTNLDHLVALKEYLPSSLVRRTPEKTISPITARSRVEYEQGLESFLREARTLVKFTHPNIVRVMSVFEANSSAYLVMEYERGVEFRDYVKQRRAINEIELIDLFLGIIDGLDQVHQTGYLHRDIKPVNLIIRDNGSPVLLDFGSSRRVDGDGENTSFVSAGYTALEQYRAGAGLEVGPWTDIYALGGTLYYAITGESPVNPVSRLAAHVRGAADPLRSATDAGAGRYSERFLQAIDWALSFQTGDRPATLAEWRESLQLARDQSSGNPVEIPQSTATQAVVDEGITGQTPHVGGSKLLVRQRAQSSGQPRQKPGNRRTGLWVGSIVLLGLLLIAANIGYRSVEKKQALHNELSRFEADLAATDVPLSAISGFRAVLEKQPDNQRALDGVEKGIASIHERASQQIDTWQIEAAAKTIESLQSLGVQTDDLVDQLEAAKVHQSVEAQINEIRSFNSAGRYDESLQQIEATRALRADTRLDKLEQDAQAGIERAETEKRDIEKQRRQSLDRIAEANKRQRARRQSYNNYLSSVESALARGDNQSARRWLESAKALQIDDQALASLDRQVVQAEEFAGKPLTEYEIRYAANRFNALKDAIEVKNNSLISQLSAGTPSKKSFLENLFTRYRQITLEVVDVQAAVNPKRVTAILRIETLALANGDIVYPAKSYRDFPVSLRRERYHWSKIEW